MIMRSLPNRTRAIQVVVKGQLNCIGNTRLTKELENLNLDEERAIAEEGMVFESETWPAY